MKNVSKFFVVALATLVGLSSCGEKVIVDNTTPFKPTMSDTQIKSVLAEYSDNVIVANYTELATLSKTMLIACEAIDKSEAEDKTAEIKAACDAWKAARIVWERSEAYLFGPVDTEAIDPGIDSWPLSLTDLKTLLADWVVADDFKKVQGNDGSMKGFHAIEYMLFADGKEKIKTVNTFDVLGDVDFKEEDTAKLESYLVAVAEELYRSVLKLEAEWNFAGLSVEKKADFEAFGAENLSVSTVTKGAYAVLFKTAGDAGNTSFTSLRNGLDQIFNGCVIISDEVGGAKIADPIKADLDKKGSGLLLVESWFSHNSVSDFTNNMRGIKAAYFGTRDAAASEPVANSLGAYIKSGNADLDLEVRAAIEKAITDVDAMAKPFRNNLTWTAANKSAQESCLGITTAMNKAKAAMESGFIAK